MKKKLFRAAAIVTVAVSLSSCSAVGLVGLVYHGTTTPTAVTSNTAGTKVGTSTALSVLGVAAVGDAGVNKAAKNGGITKISHVDSKSFSVLGLFYRVTTVVYGE